MCGDLLVVWTVRGQMSDTWLQLFKIGVAFSKDLFVNVVK